jgi:hypothetical protein
MKKWILAGLMAVVILPIGVERARAYDMDCAIMLCMAGGFPPSAVCAAAYRVMIIRITPWPVLPPFGICSFVAVPVSLGGSGGTEELDISTPDFAWLRKTRVLWWWGRVETERGGDRFWSWVLTSCDGENRTCGRISQGGRSLTPWPSSFASENGQRIPAVGAGRGVMIEFGDYEGTMGRSEWFRY